ncbi:MAG: UDP-3-O-(3-hydroxymyristoyl)glucosamine N-acyltransferase [Gammaproteobacteria bacterium]|nr:UDP-3-O-(3-hydroxymyristoyl)glucosamine N-acyltransferase [Gammaproteobacteria bacterium]MCP4088833.1 UDP-3-O-(3-hydroxymyristoyl)glucosamine N-acyltransferase [Gammaproteobacteria bacterium]MCP4274849.1 UDP-3-O-(3-hydroxymyristoyl)glucosamine N-acyltransferase [Gammaproteobacteria bacterium]MCP4832084.1 UDP-3-O-(3-hydroxymyristoyl)glucosamine N-acyltransferase [Gammaproteobacteria bacterium]MCP4928315.1 UDP-3-O-(3-hydroxymyristoyl)glucosamine N-acyltransferase [Gammaproteobacteria bacterium
MTILLAELAVRYGCELHGHPDTEISAVGTLKDAREGEISFLANPGYRKFLATTQASAVILSKELAAECPVACLVAADPYLAYARIAAELHPLPELNAGVHPAAVVSESAVIPSSCEISAGAVLASGVKLGERVSIGPNCVIGENSVVGDDSCLLANVSVYDGCEIGSRCLLHAGVVIGSDGFGIAKSEQGWVKVPQIGAVILGDDVEIGALSTIDRGAIENTVLGNGVKIDNQVQIAHNVTVGDHTAIAAQSGISGSTKVGARCIIGGKAAIAGHIEIADDVYLQGGSGVANSIKDSGIYSSAISVEPVTKWRRIAARLKNIDKIAKRLAALEKRVAKNKNRSD